MGLREKLNNSPQLGLGIGAIVMVGAMIWGYMAWKEQSPAMPVAYYSIDDGQSYFEDTPGKTVPFEYKGKEAVSASVFRGKDGKPFVGYLERSNPEAKALIEKFKTLKAGDTPPDSKQLGLISKGREYKKPGEKEWVSEARQGDVVKIKTVTQADGSPAIRVE